MEPLKILAVFVWIAILCWWLGAWYYYWVALPSYNQQKIEFDREESRKKDERLKQEKKEAEERVNKKAEEERMAIEQKKYDYDLCIRQASKDYSSEWTSSCEAYKITEDDRVKKCNREVMWNYCDSEYKLDKDWVCLLPKEKFTRIEENLKSSKQSCENRFK